VPVMQTVAPERDMIVDDVRYSIDPFRFYEIPENVSEKQRCFWRCDSTRSTHRGTDSSDFCRIWNLGSLIDLTFLLVWSHAHGTQNEHFLLVWD
jgi:hypothetical protein